jgi:alkanesulfonate monooxygenase SsuD/methylene tetrahydromethanopterin reductase-like flavin-dependent oxidoreductase (luciferase family)
MRHGIVLFTCDRGITPARAAKAAEERGFDAFYVPEHTHIPVKREAPHPRTGDGTLPDDRYTRTLDGWMTTPGEQDIGGKASALQQAWAAENRPGTPDIRVLVAAKPAPGDLATWAAAGATELLWGLPDASPEVVEGYLDRLAARVRPERAT